MPKWCGRLKDPPRRSESFQLPSGRTSELIHPAEPAAALRCSLQLGGPLLHLPPGAGFSHEPEAWPAQQRWEVFPAEG